jgi:hypothetical protein
MHCRASPAELKSTVHDAMHYVLRSPMPEQGSTWSSRKSIRWRIVLVAIPPTRRGGWWGGKNITADTADGEGLWMALVTTLQRFPSWSLAFEAPAQRVLMIEGDHFWCRDRRRGDGWNGPSIETGGEPEKVALRARARASSGETQEGVARAERRDGLFPILSCTKSTLENTRRLSSTCGRG